MGDLPADRQVGYVAIGAANGPPPAIGHYLALAQVYDRPGVASALQTAGFWRRGGRTDGNVAGSR